MTNSAKSLLDMLGAPAKPAKLAESALIIVDTQREYLDGSIPLNGIDKALVELKLLLEKSRKLGIPIYHIVHHAPAGAPIFNPDGPMSQIIEDVKPVGDERVISKSLPSAFVNTELNDLLKESNQKELVIAGFMTHMCINATTRSAVDLGFSPTVVGNACATRDLPGPGGIVVKAESVHNSNLASLADLLACVVDTADELS